MAADQPSPAAHPHAPHTTTQRRLLTLAAGLGVAVLAGAAFVLTYQDLRTLALAGGAARRWAPAYPVMIDALITVTVLALVAARHARWWSRWLRWALLLALLGGAAAAGVQRAVKGYGPLPDQPLKAGVAVAPHLMILIAVWLWLTMFKQARFKQARRAAPQPPPAPPEPPAPPPEASPEVREAPRAPEDHNGDMIPGLAQPVDLADEPVDFAVVPGPPADDPRIPEVPASLTGNPDEDPTPPSGFPLTLPTDVELVRGSRRDAEPAQTTQPDIVAPDLSRRPVEDDDDEPVADRAEDPDAGDEDEPSAGGRHRLRRPYDANPGSTDVAGSGHALAQDAGVTAPDLDADEVARWSDEAAEAARQWTEDTVGELTGDETEGAFEPDRTTTVEWTPPSSKFRSSPTPPKD